ncbi:hypothetical protein Acr_11g0007420 [Actinidia rufa]|uniref:Uncharacterized protein n=1 Tax=Actinidia rufa TaxID=165716 RepID=A0A7J0FDD3_9ERIC|nr:hypothetical protein Acr_11g0007420 [Actinidia rufa]
MLSSFSIRPIQSASGCQKDYWSKVGCGGGQSQVKRTPKAWRMVELCSLAVLSFCGNANQCQQKRGGDGRLYSESMSELASSKMMIDTWWEFR